VKRLILLTTVLSILLTGCGNSDIQWFEREKKVGLTAITDNAIENDKYYIKQGTRFFKVALIEDGSYHSTNTLNESRVVPVIDSNTAIIPSHYLNEGIAFKSNDKLLTEVNFERYECLGYSIGVYNGSFDENGYFEFDKSRNVAKKSDLSKILSKISSNDIRIVSINGSTLTPGNVNNYCGVVTGLEANKSYEIEFLAGTQYFKTDVVADTLMLKSYELYSYDNENISFTENGYMIFNTPTDLKSGYYNVNGEGIFKYYAYEKGASDDLLQDMNVSYYETESDKIKAISKQFTVDIPARTKDLEINISYNNSNLELIGDEYVDNTQAIVYAPDGTKYEMKKEKNKNNLQLLLSEASAGEWQINITPKDVEIIDVSTSSSKKDEEATLKEETILFEQDEENVKFIAISSGLEETYGYVVSPSGRTYDLSYEAKKDRNESELTYVIPFVEAGEWQVKVYYHPTTTDILEIKTSSEKETDTDVIILE